MKKIKTKSIEVLEELKEPKESELNLDIPKDEDQQPLEEQLNNV